MEEKKPKYFAPPRVVHLFDQAKKSNTPKRFQILFLLSRAKEKQIKIYKRNDAESFSSYLVLPPLSAAG